MTPEGEASSGVEGLLVTLVWAMVLSLSLLALLGAVVVFLL